MKVVFLTEVVQNLQNTKFTLISRTLLNIQDDFSRLDTSSTPQFCLFFFQALQNYSKSDKDYRYYRHTQVRQFQFCGKVNVFVLLFCFILL